MNRRGPSIQNKYGRFSVDRTIYQKYSAILFKFKHGITRGHVGSAFAKSFEV